jgi:hypothetical protein
MAVDKNLIDLTAASSLDDADLLYVLADPDGTPLDRKAAASLVWTYVTGKLATATLTVAALQVTRTTEQMRVRYDANNYFTATVGATGDVTLDAVGTGAGFRFNDNLAINAAVDAGRVINADLTYTNTSGSLFGIYFASKLSPASASSAVLYSFAAYPSDDSAGTNANNLGGLVGFFARPVIYHPGGTTGYVYGFQTSINFTSISKGTTTEVIGYLAGAASKHASSTETIGTCIGVKILAQTIGTTNWSLYVDGGNSYFGGSVGIGQTTFGTSATSTLAMATGTAPSTSPADAFQMYSADQAAGNACPHIRTENGGIVKLYKETTAVAEAAFTENAGGAAVNVDSTFGGYTLQQVVQALQNLGILT